MTEVVFKPLAILDSDMIDIISSLSPPAQVRILELISEGRIVITWAGMPREVFDENISYLSGKETVVVLPTRQPGAIERLWHWLFGGVR